MLAMDFEPSDLRADVLRLETLQHPEQANTWDSMSYGDLSGFGGIDEKAEILTRRSPNIPLTFEDLAQPIEHPGTAKERWVEFDGSAESTANPSQVESLSKVSSPLSEQPARNQSRPKKARMRKTAGIGDEAMQETGSLWSSTEKRWTAEQIFNQSQTDPGATGRFASTPARDADGEEGSTFRKANGKIRYQRDGVTTPYASGWRGLPDVEESEVHHQWITQPR